MTQATPNLAPLKFLQDRWDASFAATLDEAELLRYRSNLLGSDLRITNFAGGNTSSKIQANYPATGEPVTVLWVKGSGGDLGSIQRGGFATLYQRKFLALEESYQGIDSEDEMVGMYPRCAFASSSVAASIDTPLHGFLPFPHIDHLHPDWGIALAASANGKVKMDEFNREFGHSLVWMPWLRPGFELGLRMRRVVAENPGCDGIVLGGHGLFTWGETQRECYLKTLTVIDQLGQFIESHGSVKGGIVFGGEIAPARINRQELAIEIAPFLRGRVSAQNRWIASFTDAVDVLRFINSAQGRELAFLGTSCPDHFIRTKIRPLFVPWTAGEGLTELKAHIDFSLAEYREQYRSYYHAFATADSPALRDPNPTVVLIQGLGMFSFGKNKTEARIVGEFYLNAIHVMEGATLLDEGPVEGTLPQCAAGADGAGFKVFSNYVALPAVEAFRIEYWAMEEAKIRRLPPEKELSRKIVLIVGDGRETAINAAVRGAHVVVAGNNKQTAEQIVEDLKSVTSREFVGSVTIDINRRASVTDALRATVKYFGGLDIVIDCNSPKSPLLAEEVAKLFAEQGLDGSYLDNL
jgi:rhamnose utilization protein RhaD (predicted bifunctional aldolase and dehydrogenase)